jgi:hypothetical protein
LKLKENLSESLNFKDEQFNINVNYAIQVSVVNRLFGNLTEILSENINIFIVNRTIEENKHQLAHFVTH